MVTLKQIAKELHLGVSTVSSALHSDDPRYKPETRQRVREAAQRLGYRPDPLARALRTKRTFTVGLLTGSFRAGIGNLKVEAIEQSLVREHYQVLMGFTNTEWKRTFEYAQTMLARMVDGLIIADGADLRQFSDELLPLLKAAQSACVVIDPSVQGRDERLPCVEVDRREGMRQVGRHLVELGHRDIAFAFTHHPQAHKLNGLLDGLGDFPLRGADLFQRGDCALRSGTMTTADPQVHAATALLGGDGEQAAYEKGKEIAGWSQRPTAIVAPSDTLAMPLIGGLLDGGVRVPEQISVVGFDDIEEARFFRPALTTVHQPRAEVGEAALQLLMDQIEGKPLRQTHVLLTPQLVVRQSTGPARN